MRIESKCFIDSVLAIAARKNEDNQLLQKLTVWIDSTGCLRCLVAVARRTAALSLSSVETQQTATVLSSQVMDLFILKL